METPTKFEQISEDILAPLWKGGLGYWSMLLAAVSLMVVGGRFWWVQINTGLGVAGITRPAGWGIYIATFVFWVGIAHSGTLISAILYLFHVPWRAAVSRSAEAMTIFAIMTAGLFPLIHIGRPWFFYWLIPYPNERQLWVNFRSPLIWDVFAVGTYFTISLIFWYLGMVPDLALIRDRTTGAKKAVYGLFSLGWRGSSVQWHHFRAAFLFLAALATPLVISVHSVVSWDFAMSIVPGWHSTIFAPYFVAGAIFSGLAMVLTLVIPLRRAFRLERYITLDHFNQLSKLLLFMSFIISYAYITEFFTAWYSGNPVERSSFYYRAMGPYRMLFWIMTLSNCAIPLLLFSSRVRRNLKSLFVISLLANVGMYLERFIIIPVSLTHDYDPYIWNLYHPTKYELAILAGSFGFFLTWFLLFIKFVPTLPIYEIKELAEQQWTRPQPARAIGNDLGTKASSRVVGISSHQQPLSDAIEQLRQQGYGAIETFSPTGSEELLHALHLGKSPVRFYTLAGGIIGFLSGLGLTIWTSLSWPLISGGKPIVSIPPYMVIVFELTILFGGLFTLLGWLIHARLPRKFSGTTPDARFSSDKFGVFVACEGRQAGEVQQLLLAAGVEEVSFEAT